MTSDAAQNPFVGSGIKQDLHLLFNKFSAADTTKIQDFADIFREARFDTIFHFRIGPTEHLEFSEYLLQNAADYFGKHNENGAARSFRERIFGIYACYALYNLQPVDHICQIPVTETQFDELLTFLKCLESEKILEPVAALKNLILKKAFRIKVFQSTYDPATHKKYLSEEDVPNYSTKPIEPFARVKALQNQKLFGEILVMHNVYTQAKKDFGLTDIQLVEKIDPTEEIQKSLEKYQKELEAVKDGTAVPSTSTKDESAGTRRSALRSKAYSAGLKHTRQRRHLDPNMEENFKHLTFGQIAQDCLEGVPVDQERHQKPRRKRRTSVEPIEVIDEHALAEQVLRDEYASRVKPEIEEHEKHLGMKIGKQGTSGVAKIRAPKRKNGKLITVKSELTEDDQPTTSSQINTSFNSPEKKKPTLHVETKPQKISDEWANKLHTWQGEVQATDKQLKKFTNQIKLEMIDEDEP